jgi:PTS system fructose-specific IIC component
MARSEAFRIKKHLLTGVSYMIPVVVAGGLCMALAKIIGGPLVGDATGTIGFMINSIGASAMTFVVPVMTAFIAYSIADRPGIAPGLTVGLISTNIKAGFLGGIFAGLLVGFLILAIKKYVKPPKAMQGLMPIVFIPFVATLVIGLLMLGVLGGPIATIQNAILDWMKSMADGSRFVLGAIIGGMMGFDLGGPINKTASLFANGLMAEKIFEPEAAKIVGGMVPPLGVALSVFASRSRYSKAEREAAKAAVPLGLCFITEGVLPFAASDPLRVIPACVIGSASAAALTMFWGVASTIPHGGIFVVPFMVHPLLFLVALAVGSTVTAAILTFLKPVKAEDEDEEVAEKEVDIDSFSISDVGAAR